MASLALCRKDFQSLRHDLAYVPHNREICEFNYGSIRVINDRDDNL